MLLVVLIMWRLRSYASIMDLKLTYGVLELFFTFCYLGFHHFGQVIITMNMILLSSMVVFVLFTPVLQTLDAPSFFLEILAEKESGIFKQILSGKLDFHSAPWPSISDSAKELVQKMLERDPRKRISAHEVLCTSYCPKLRKSFFMLNSKMIWLMCRSPMDCG